LKAFITGVAGFAGLHLAEHLLEQGDEVLGVIRPESPHTLPSEMTRGKLRALPWDICENPSPSMQSQIADFAPDAIYHLAAISVPAACGGETPSELARRLNVGGVQSVVDLATSLPSRPRLLFISSCYVYAPVDSAAPVVSEVSAVAPVSAYGQTKQQGEQIVANAVAQGKLQAVIARVFQHTGPRQVGPMLVPEWSEQLVASHDQPIHVGTFDAKLDLSDVRDVVRAYRVLIEEGNSGEIYNVGGGVSIRTGDIFNQLVALTNTPRTGVESSPGPRQQPIADLTKIQSHTSWRPTIPLEKTLSDTLEYWRRRQDPS